MRSIIDSIYKKDDIENIDVMKTPRRIASIYVLIGCLWILFSDRILSMIVIDKNIYSNIQTYKGWFFVFFTAILLYRLILNDCLKIKKLSTDLRRKNIESNNNLIVIEEKNEELQRVINVTNDFFMLTTKILENRYVNDEVFLSETLKIAYNLVKESNVGSAYIVENGKIRFIDAIGFDMESLGKIQITPEEFEYKYNDIKIKNYPELSFKRKIGNHTYEDYSKKNVELKQSIYVGISNEDNLYGGFSLDISKECNVEFSDESIRNLKAFQQLVNGFYKVKKVNDQRNLEQSDIVHAFISALEFHDEYTKGHSEAVALYSLEIGKYLKFDGNQLNDLYWAATIHDIGKIIIPQSILNKSDKLTKEEYEHVKQHTQIGYDILSKADSLRDVSKYVLLHHERWDGTGYPVGLKGEEIPLISQIIAVADSWHAMTSDRPYKRGITKDEGIEELKNNKGSQFAPHIVDVFLEILLKETD
ncbi:HD-GYP domain-containing protein [Oceanirhabdus seepicola]|uniref:HD-GYP domain-containing protein n=1 Tax=Oceanirhabdus seepicola TaxID=2828781 RepID=A0A9J6P5Y4_9CLOT|nr:HD-GYP domain-containing protein [Oceanirhabdus seepicola]MCM1992234.1 HD-GYP domain-containing protein [Oceanirhabdus seepicola]